MSFTFLTFHMNNTMNQVEEELYIANCLEPVGRLYGTYRYRGILIVSPAGRLEPKTSYWRVYFRGGAKDYCDAAGAVRAIQQSLGLLAGEPERLYEHAEQPV